MSMDVAEIESFYQRAEGVFVAGLLHQDLELLQTIWTEKDAHQRAPIDKIAVGFPFSLLESHHLPAVLMPAETGALAWGGTA
ncbi:MAG: hypothetical protein VXW06_04720, partial [Pseudomonadota bacterium]|nr:hypothetical protein [Pseudomonadota bacterium]